MARIQFPKEPPFLTQSHEDAKWFTRIFSASSRETTARRKHKFEKAVLQLSRHRDTGSHRQIGQGGLNDPRSPRRVQTGLERRGAHKENAAELFSQLGGDAYDSIGIDDVSTRLLLGHDSVPLGLHFDNEIAQCQELGDSTVLLQ